jgi:hypothetical protein
MRAVAANWQRRAVVVNRVRRPTFPHLAAVDRTVDGFIRLGFALVNYQPHP